MSSYYCPTLCLWQCSSVSQRPAVAARGPVRTVGSLGCSISGPRQRDL